jgi:tight adherence protein B
MRTRRLALALVAAALAVSGASAAVAADGAGSPSLTDVHVEHGRLRGVLSVPGAGSAQGIDPGSVRVRFGDRTAQPAQLTSVAQERRAALIMIDTSGSMAGGGLAAAKAAAATFLDQVPADIAVGLASFADKPHMLVRPTTDRAAVRTALKTLVAKGSTSLYDAIAQGDRVLGDDGSRTIVLLSDGADTVSTTGFTSATRALGASGIRPVVVGFRTGDTQNGVLRKLASAGNGVFTRALDTATLQQAFGSAAQEIASQERVSAAVPPGLGGTQRVTITGTAGGRAFRVFADVSLPHVADTTAPAAPVTRAPATGRSVLPWFAAGAVFVGLLGLLLAASASRLSSVAKQRIRGLDGYLSSGGGHASEASAHPLGSLSASASRVADAYIRNRPSAARTGLLLERADLPLRLNEWYIMRIVALPVVAVVLTAVFGGSGGARWATIIGTLVIAGAVPPLALRFLAKRRARQFEVQLPDVLTLIATSLSTGFTLGQALDAITRDAAEPSAKEFSRTLAQTRIGVDLDDALERTAERMDSVNLRWTTMAIRIQRRVGGDLAEVMRTTATTLRDRESLHRQVRALSAEGRLSAYILIAMPVLLAVYMFFVNRSYLSLLWHRQVGVAMLIGSGILLCIGWIWMRRIIEVKV